MTQYVINIGALPNDGTGDPLRTAFNDVNLNFNQVWATGLIGSNIGIANNTILTTNTNGNLILNPNGIGNVVANAHVLPDRTRVRNLGSSSLKWDTVYAQYVDIGGTLTVSGDATVTGNLSVIGNVVQVGNIITDAKTIQLANTAGTANAANGSGITVGANDNIATMLYSSSSNVWAMNIGLQTGNIILSGDNIFDLNGPKLSNGDLTSGWTARLALPTNGNTSPITLQNTYGNVIFGAGANAVVTSSWTFDNTGNLVLPSNTANINYANGVSILNSVGGTPAGANTYIQFNDDGEFGGVSTFTFDKASNVMTLPGNAIIQVASGDLILAPDGNGTVIIEGDSINLLRLVGTAANAQNKMLIDTYGNGLGSFGGGTYIGTYRREGVPLQAGDRLVSLLGRGSTDGENINPSSAGRVQIEAYDAWSSNSTPTQISFWTTNTGTLTPAENVRIEPTGNLSVFNGNLIVTGGGGYLQGNSITGNGGLYAGIPGFTPLGTDIVTQFAGNVNSYSQINFENINDGTQASGDYIVTADNGDDSNNFIDMGIASSTWDGTQDNSLGTDVEANDGYLYVNGANLVVGTAITGGNVNTWKFDTAGNLSAGGNIVPKVSNVYSLGNSTNQWSDLYVSNATIYMNNVPISLTAGNILTVDGQDVVTTAANGVTNLGNLEVNGTTLSIAGTSSETTLNISPEPEGWAYLQLPNDATANTANTRLHNDAGNVEIATGDFSTGSSSYSWYFDNTGNLNLPTNGSINVNGGSIVQTPDENFKIVVQDAENDGWALQLEVTDGSNVGSRIEQTVDQVEIGTGLAGNAYYWQFDDSGRLVVPGDIWGTYNGNLSILARGVTDSSFVEIATQDNSDIKRSNVTVTRDNVTVTTSSGARNWTFDLNGVLTLPGGNINFNPSNDYLSINTLNGGAIEMNDGVGNLGAVGLEAGENAFITVAINDGPQVTWTFDGNGNLTVPGNIVSNDTILIDNRDSGVIADITLYSADNILLQGADRTNPGEPEGGDINIYAGSGAADNGTGGTGGGDIQIAGGPGGAANTSPGGFGGTVDITGGNGGDGSATARASGGGSISITAGNGGTDNGGGGYTGGGVFITAGDSTDSASDRGSIVLASGAGGDETTVGGYVQISIPASGTNPGGQWTFTGTGLTLEPPPNGEIFSPNTGNLTVGTVGNTIIRNIGGVTTYDWVFSDTGALTVPPISTGGEGEQERAVIKGTRTVVGETGTWSTYIDGHSAFGAVAWTASSTTIQSAKITFVVQTNGTAFNWEQFDVSICKFDGSNAFVSVSGRIKQNSAIADTEVSAYDSEDGLQVWLNPADGQTSAYINYYAVEFNIMPD